MTTNPIPPATSVSALVDRCEAATGPDRELDKAIARAVGTIMNYTVPAYTASLDAAMTLVPEDHALNIETISGGLAYANVWLDVSDHDGTAPNESRAATPALALCTAALRAIALQENSNVE